MDDELEPENVPPSGPPANPLPPGSGPGAPPLPTEPATERQPQPQPKGPKKHHTPRDGKPEPTAEQVRNYQKGQGKPIRD
jgi:hypothetical protein